MHTLKKLVLLFLFLSALPLLLVFFSNRIAPAIHAWVQDALGDEWELSIEFWRDGQTMLLLLAVTVLVSLVVFIRKKGYIGRSRFRLPKPKEIAAAIMVGLAMVFFLQGALHLFRHAFPETAETLLTRFSRIAEDDAFPFFFAVVLVSPFFEEILFRGILFRLFEKEKVALWLSLVLTSFLFALYRVDLFEGVYAFFLGLVIGLAYIWSGSLWIPILIHYTHNLGASWFERTDLPFEMTYVMLPVAFVILPLALVFFYRRREANR